MGASGEESLSLWNVETKQLARIFPGNTGIISAAAIDADESTAVAVCSVNEQPTLIHWELASGQELRRFTLSETKNAWIASARFSPDAKLLAANLGGSEMGIW